MTSNPKKKRNVLVLEDEAFIAMMLQDELEALGIHVIGPVNNLKSAITLAETSELDGALLDLNINGTYATEVANKLRARDKSWSRKSAQGDKWSFCLTAGTLCP